MRGARGWPRRPLVWFYYMWRVKGEVAVMNPAHAQRTRMNGPPATAAALARRFHVSETVVMDGAPQQCGREEIRKLWLRHPPAVLVLRKLHIFSRARNFGTSCPLRHSVLREAQPLDVTTRLHRAKR